LRHGCTIERSNGGWCDASLLVMAACRFWLIRMAGAWLWWKAHHRRMTAVFMPPPMSGWQQHARCLKPDFVTIGRFRVSDVNSQKPCFPFPLIKEIYTQQAEAVLYSRRSSTVRRATDPDSAQDFTKRSAKHNSFLAPGTNGWSTQGWLAL
jgi:hypothetical protein